MSITHNMYLLQGIKQLHVSACNKTITDCTRFIQQYNVQEGM